MNAREVLRLKKRIVIKIGTSSITHDETGNIDLEKLEKFVRILINLRNKGKEVIVVSSGAIGIGRNVLGIKENPQDPSVRHACAAIGQARLMMIYEKLFNEYGQLTAQVLLTKESIMHRKCKKSAKETFSQLFKMNVVPIINENDAIAVDEDLYGGFGDNDTMAAYIVKLVKADLLILLSDIEGLYTDNPKVNPQARFVHTVYRIDDELENMGKGTTTQVGTGGMATKIEAAKICVEAGSDMVIANGESIYVINDIMAGKRVGTLFLAGEHEKENELAKEREQYRRIAKRRKREESKR